MKRSSAISTAAYLTGLVYCLVLASVLGSTSLWVDELMQLAGTRSGTFAHVGELTRAGVGGVPLGWLPQLTAIHLFGYSTVAARIPSALASVGLCVTVFLIAKNLSMRYPLLPASLIALLPLQFRYALEGRPYAQGLLLSAVATLIFVKLTKNDSLLWFLAYSATLILGIYSQPFTCFPACAHLVWALTIAPKQRRVASFAAGALLLMALTFLPWYGYAAPLWQQNIQAEGFEFHLTWKSPLMLLRELTGAGYLGSVIVLPLAVFGFYKGPSDRAMKQLLLLCSIVPVICVLIVDARFNYFLAIRQMIFVLAPLCLLAADGLFALAHFGHRKAAALTALMLAAVLIAADIRWLKKPREDWGLAASAVQNLRKQYSACTLFAPTDSLRYYTFFESDLRDTTCPPTVAAGQPIVLAISPYITATDREKTVQLLQRKKIIASQITGMSTITVFH